MADAIVAFCLLPLGPRSNPNPTLFLHSSSSVDMTRTGRVPFSALVFRSSSPKNFKQHTSFKIRVWEEEDDNDELDDDDDEEEKEDLEEEVYEFMMSSKNPSAFPTKDELIAAGRVDLAAAIAQRGGWLALGWDLEEREGDDRVFSSSTASSSGRAVEVDWEEEEEWEQEGEVDSGVQGILCRLEKERSLYYGIGTERTPTFAGDNWDSRTSAPQIFPSDYRKSQEQALLGDMHLEYELQTHALGRYSNGKINGSFVSGKKSQNQIHMRLQELESRLSSTLTLLRSNKAVMPSKSNENLGNEFHDLSDAWEFKQTEVIKAQDKLRSIRAKLAVLEGKISLEKVYVLFSSTYLFYNCIFFFMAHCNSISSLSEVEKAIEEKQKRVDTVQKALHMLRTACIVWPNSAAEVLLSGSFDGWASQRRMERSGSGIFFLYMKLYPGQYEIKFIVDGVWRIDPLRPIVNSDGFENNLLIVT